MLCRAKMGDITALFNLPKKVAAGSGAAAAELEQQLQKAQDQARREHERAQQLEQEMKVCTCHVSPDLSTAMFCAATSGQKWTLPRLTSKADCVSECACRCHVHYL
jgi:hypothetical protein